MLDRHKILEYCLFVVFAHFRDSRHCIIILIIQRNFGNNYSQFTLLTYVFFYQYFKLLESSNKYVPGE